MFQNLQDMIFNLKNNPNVVGVARYGNRHHMDMSPGGDFDLFVFVKDRPPEIESIHFHVHDIPVDLNLRTLDDLKRNEPISEFDRVLYTADILYDESGDLGREIDSLKDRWMRRSNGLNEHDISMNRFCQRHVLDKVKGRIDSEPLLCEFLLASNIRWLFETYFRIRSMPFPGEKSGFQWLDSNEPQIYAEIQRFFSTQDLGEKLGISERMTELILAPIGGPWCKGELIVFAADPKHSQLQEKGMQIFSDLFGIPFDNVFSKT